MQCARTVNNQPGIPLTNQMLSYLTNTQKKQDTKLGYKLIIRLFVTLGISSAHGANNCSKNSLQDSTIITIRNRNHSVHICN